MTPGGMKISLTNFSAIISNSTTKNGLHPSKRLLFTFSRNGSHLTKLFREPELGLCYTLSAVRIQAWLPGPLIGGVG
jgi:hypothetical protein